VISVTFAQDQHVKFQDNPKFTGVYKIVGIGPANLLLEPLAGGPKVKTSKDLAPVTLRLATEEEVRAAEAARPAVRITMNMVVTYNRPEAAGHLFVVVKLHLDGTFNLLRLGTTAGWRNVRPERVTVVPADKIEEAYRKANEAL
jgi:hypothetical protein